MARRYVRDARGRFASGSYQGQTSGRGSRLRAPGKAPQRGSTIRASAPAGTIGKSRRSAQPRNNVRPAGGLSRGPASAIRPTNRRSQRQPPLGLKANAVRGFEPKSPMLRIGQLERQVERRIQDMDRSMKRASKEIKPRADKLRNRLQRQNAKAISDRMSKNWVDRELSRIELGVAGGRPGAKAIQRRMQRAAAAASRGSKPAARARSIYANQLAYMGTGKPKAAKSNIRPGPRNTKGPPKRQRRRRSR